MVIQAMKDALDECPREIKIYVEYCKSLFASFITIEFFLVNRNRNTITQYGDNYQSYVWTRKSPQWLLDVLHKVISACN